MKNFIIFFSIVLIVYGLVNYYIFIRGWQALPKDSPLRSYYLITFLFLAVSYIAARFLERYSISIVSDVLTWIGAFWLGAMVYFLLAVIILDILRLSNHLTGFFPGFITADYAKIKLITMGTVIGLVIIVVIGGRINALTPKLVDLTLDINKQAGNTRQLRIAAASDIHLGTLISNSRLDHLIERINSLNPDIILLPGDIVDEDLGPVIKENLGAKLLKFKARYGIYAITGNHEFIGGVEAATRYLSEHGIIMLRDSVVKIDNSFYLVGREDRSVNSRKKRKSLSELMHGVDKSLPVIMMDHQPFGLDEAESNGVDLQISGHTHHGQLWPFNYITRMVYEVSWGYKKKGNTHIYVSSGFGGWGPPIRLGNTPEILNIVLNLSK